MDRENATQEFEKYPELTANILYLYENGKGFNLIWWSKFLSNINAALTKAALTQPAVDVEGLKHPQYKEARGVFSEDTAAHYERGKVVGWNEAIDHLTTHYDLVKREKNNGI